MLVTRRSFTAVLSGSEIRLYLHVAGLGYCKWFEYQRMLEYCISRPITKLRVEVKHPALRKIVITEEQKFFMLYRKYQFLASHRCGLGSVLRLGAGCMFESLSVTCRRLVVFSGYSGFLPQ